MLPRSRLASLAVLVCLGVGPFVVGSLGGCMANTTDEDVEASDNNLTEHSDALVLAAANTLDEDTLDLEVGLGPRSARTIVTRRPFKKVESLRAFLTSHEIRLLLDYAKAHGLAPTPVGSGSASAYPSAGWGWDASPYPSASASVYPSSDGGAYYFYDGGRD